MRQRVAAVVSTCVVERVPGTEITPRESRRLSTGLIVYGAVGVLLSIAAVVAVFWLNGEFSDTRDELSVQVDQLEQTLAATSQSIVDAADTADGFTATLDDAAPGLASASRVIGRLQTTVTRVPSLPFGSSAESLQSLASDLGALSVSLGGIASSLAPNSEQLTKTTTQLRTLAGEVDNLRGTLEDGLVERGADQGFNFLRAGIIALTIWLALPSVAALLIGIWLRRAVSPAKPARA